MKKIFLKQEKISGKERLEDYIKILSDACSDFAKVKINYEKAYEELRKIFKDIDKIVDYTNDMLISSLEFSFEQGFNDNLKHFKNPNESTFFEKDYDEILKETELRTKSDYIEAETNLKKYVELLPINSLSLYDVIVEYRAFLESYIPKMAHYYGFKTGNNTLQNNIKGYMPDLSLTQRYKDWLSIYLDLNLE